jgi:hypothetical protein
MSLIQFCAYAAPFVPFAVGLIKFIPSRQTPPLAQPPAQTIIINNYPPAASPATEQPPKSKSKSKGNHRSFDSVTRKVRE